MNSCNGKSALFQRMFPCAISENFTLSPKKASHLITDALGPYFKNQLLADLNANENSLTIQFDETCNNKNFKELQIRVIYWSESERLVVNRHLETKFIERATGEKLFEHLMQSMDSNGLTMKRVLTLGRDGPNVNKKVARLFVEKCKELHLKKMLDFGSCYLHIVNNAFLSRLKELSIDVGDLIENIKKFFDRSDLRQRHFEKI